jgi:superfamily II DNA or RNA helicase
VTHLSPLVNSWNDFKNHLEAKSALEKGTAFEELTRLYLEYHPVYRTKLKTVWLQKEIPTTVRESLNLPSNDQGIDLVAETYEGTYWAIQCKYLQDENQTLSHRSISTFVSLSTGIAEKIAHCLVCTTVDDYAKIYKGRKNIGFINADEWRKLDQTFFDWCRARAKGQSLKLTPSQPRPHQQKALDSAQVYFGQEGNHRGKLIFPCGAGKSLTGFWMLQQLKARSTLIAVPSLALVKQTLDVYLREIVALDRKVKWLCVCSDEGIGKDDDVVFYTENLGVPCLTDPAYIQNWLLQNKNEEIILFTTYQSGRIVGEACQKMNFTFDLGIYDEAHKTVGAEKKLFSYLLFDENIRVQKRIFMTATERFYRGSKDDIISMDDEDIYGETFAHMSFKEAIDLGLLTDYKVITIEVSKAEIADFIKKNHLVQTNEKWNKDTEARSLASMLALRKAMDRYPIRNAVSFHSSIDKAQRSKDLQGHISTTYHYEPVDAFTVSGKVPTSKRNRIIQEFAQSPKAVITNARCLTEGVDVPNIDCIVYADPRKSKVDIVQALGRALRKKEDKEWGYVVLPVIYNAESHEIDNENFQEILSVVRGLASNDERIVDYFKDQADPTKATKKSGQQFQLQVLTEFMDEMELSSQLHIRLWDHLSRFSWIPFEEAKKIVRAEGLKSNQHWRKYSQTKRPLNIPGSPDSFYKNKGWTNWGDFLGTGNERNIDFLSYEEAKAHLRPLGLKSSIDWREYSKTKRPRNIPGNPNRDYVGKGWISWNDFLSSNTISNYQKSFIEFDNAKEVISSYNLRSLNDWNDFCKAGKKPVNIPRNPAQYYLKKGWKGWHDFLGVPSDYKKLNKKYLNFEEAKTYVHTLNLKRHDDWIKFCKDGKKPHNIPANPGSVYKNLGWKNMGDWLGTGRLGTKNRLYWPFTKSRSYVHKLKLKNEGEWRTYTKSGKLPVDIPNTPQKIYTNEWMGFGDWLGTGNIAPHQKKFMTYFEAKKFLSKFKLRTQNEYRVFCQSPNRPPDLPTNPNSAYKNSGWISFGEFLGTGTVAPGLQEYLDFPEVKIAVKALNLNSRGEWEKYCKSGNKPKNVPASPQYVYKNKGWKGWPDFLGKI